VTIPQDLRIEGYLFKAEIYVESSWNAPLFTGKLVKSLLIDSDPQLKPLFEKTRGVEPKLIHITPLYREVNGKVKCIYSIVDYDEESGVIRQVDRVRVSGRYHFYVGFIERERDGDPYLSFDRVYTALLNISGKHVFGKTLFSVELVSLQTIDVEHAAATLVESLLKNPGRSKLRVVFSSPTLLRDPFRTAKHKSLVPTPINVFSRPIYILLYLTGKLTQRNLYKHVILLHRLFNETHSLYTTVKKRWIIYEPGKKPIPVLTNYVNYYLNTAYCERYSKIYDIEDFLKKTFRLTLVLGIGTSRATGFGHAVLQTPVDGSSAGVMCFPGDHR